MMRIQEVCAALGLTKKAVEYYIQQELLSPKALDNGYRQFSKQDIERLRKISVLRKLGLTIKEIKQTLADHGDAMLQQKLMHNQQRLMHEHMRHSLQREHTTIFSLMTSPHRPSRYIFLTASIDFDKIGCISCICCETLIN